MALKIIPNEGLAVRSLSILFTHAAFLTAVLWSRAHWGFTAGLGTALALASNRIAGFYSTTGYNMVTYSFFLLVWTALSLSQSLKKWNAPALGIVGGLAGLTRLEGLLAVTLGLILQTRPWRAARQRLLIALLVTWGLATPYLAVQKIRTGQFLSSHTPHANFWMDRQGGSGSAREVNVWKNFFLSNGPGQALVQSAKGLLLGFFSYLPRLWQGAYWVLALAALGLMSLWRQGQRSVIMLLGAFLAPVAFILPLDQVAPGSGAELRFVLPLLWPTALLAGLGFSRALKMIAGCFNMIRNNIKTT